VWREVFAVSVQILKAAAALCLLGAVASAAWPHAAAAGAAAQSRAAFLLPAPLPDRYQLGAALLAALALGAHRRAASLRRLAASSARSGAPGGFGSGRRVVVIGAGPSGLVAAKYLQEAGHSVRVLEAERDIGGTFRYRSYDHGVQVSSKYLTSFTDLRLGAAAADHLPIPHYLEYLDEYSEKFGLRRLVEFGSRVLRIERRSAAQRAAGQAEYALDVQVRGAAAAVLEADAVIVCSGLHLSPLRHPIAGLESFKGDVLHSVDYKHRRQLRERRLLISGSGETALDIAYHSICPTGDEAAAVTLSTKSGFLSVPSCLPDGLPLVRPIPLALSSVLLLSWPNLLPVCWRAGHLDHQPL